MTPPANDAATAARPSGPLGPGVWGVLATPFEPGGATVDHEALRSEVAFYGRLGGSGAAGLVALGVFGEAASLSTAEQCAVLRTVVEATDLPVVAGCSARAAAPAAEQASLLVEAAGGRLAAVMVQVASGDPAVAGAALDAVHEASRAAVVVQDYPVASGVTIRPEVLAEVVAARPYVAAVKCEGPPTAVAIAAVRARVDVPCFGGLGGVGLLDELASGAAGAMTGFSFPEALVAAVDAFAWHGFAAARDVFAPWLPLANFEGQAGIGLAIRKEILRRRGLLVAAAVRPPAPQIPASLEPLIERHLAHVPAVGAPAV